jgi:hypothetical protein
MTSPYSESWVDPIFYAIERFLKKSGLLSKAGIGEPKSAPTGPKIQAALWVQSIRAIGLASGLNASTAHVLFIVRLYSNFKSVPEDRIDPDMMRAASNVIRQLSDNFDFEGTIRNVDLLGHHGDPLSCEAGYLEVDNKHYRIMDIRVPCIVNDVWTQNDSAP